MGVNVDISEVRHTENKYPFIGEFVRDRRLKVLFFSDSCGTCLSEDPERALGEYSDAWDMPSFKPFTGTITLSNKENN